MSHKPGRNLSLFGPDPFSPKVNHTHHHLADSVVLITRLFGMLCLIVHGFVFAQTQTSCPSLASTVAVSRAQFFASSTGTASGMGTLTSPWDLQTALNQPSAVTRGSTIWLLGGTYHVVVGSDGFHSHLNGTSGNPIVVRNYNGQRATIDGDAATHALTVDGSYTWYWGLEVIDSSTNRVASSPGSFSDPRAGGITPSGPGNKFINMVVHDLGGALGGGAASPDTEYFGNLVYYNGWIGPDRRHGHGFYMQNQTGLKVACDNFVGDNAENGFQVYGSGAAYLIGIRLFGNVTYNTSSWPTPQYQYNYIVTGGAPGADVQLSNAYSFLTPSANYGFMLFSVNDVTVDNSVFVGGQIGVNFQSNSGATAFTGNRVYNTTTAPRELTFIRSSSATYTWNNNTYYGHNNFFYNGNGYTFPSWQTVSGFDNSSTFTPRAPTGVWISVRPNAYESKRANIVIYNWDLANTVNVDLSSVLNVGDQFQIQDAQNFYGPSVVSATYQGGSVAIPMTGLTKEAIIGSITPAHTAPLFGTFVLLGPNGTSPPPTNVTIAPTSASTAVNDTRQFADTVTGTTNTAVMWTATGGTVSSSGLYTAGSVAGSYTVTVTSVADTTKSATAAITVNPAVGVNITISPTTATVQTGHTQQFSDTVTGSTNTAVNWSVIQGSGVVNSSGLYTAPALAETDLVQVQSQADTTKKAVATVTVTGSIPPPPSGEAGYWTFDTADVSGTTLLDRSGNGLDLTAHNTTSIPGAVNQALHFNGTNSYAIGKVSSALLDMNTDMTVAMWVRTTNSSRSEGLISKYDFAGLEYGYLLHTMATGVVELEIGRNNLMSGARFTDDTTKINDGQWHHVAVVIKLGTRGSVTFYVDGVLSSSQLRQFKAGGNYGLPLQLGLVGSSYFTGDMDQVTIYGRALSAGEVTALAVH